MTEKQSLIDRLSTGPLVLDGGMGTQLFDMGLGVSQCPHAWNIEHPDKVRAIHKAYYDAGADIIFTNTFGANKYRLSQFELQNKVSELNQGGVEAAKHLGDRPYLIAGDIGPTGYLLQPYGEHHPDDFVQCFRDQAHALEQAGVDLFAIETQSDPQEALATIKGIRKESTKPIIVSFSFQFGKQGHRTMMGTSPKEALEAVQDTDIQGFGVNCGEGMEKYLDLIPILRPLTTLPLMVKPNAGVPEMVGGITKYSESQSDFQRMIPQILSAGADLIGGCCGTTPDHIRVIREAVDAHH